MSKAIRIIKSLSIKDRYRISKSQKDFVIFRNDNTYILTNDLYEYRKEYIQKGGCFVAISVIKNEL